MRMQWLMLILFLAIAVIYSFVGSSKEPPMDDKGK